MATVAAVFSRAPWVRTAEEVVRSLFRTGRSAPSDAPAPRPQNKRGWASLVKGKAAVVTEVGEEMDRRNPQRHRTQVTLTDGERALQILVDKMRRQLGESRCRTAQLASGPWETTGLERC
jgi:hypothetical protein